MFRAAWKLRSAPRHRCSSTKSGVANHFVGSLHAKGASGFGRARPSLCDAGADSVPEDWAAGGRFSSTSRSAMTLESTSILGVLAASVVAAAKRRVGPQRGREDANPQQERSDADSLADAHHACCTRRAGTRSCRRRSSAGSATVARVRSSSRCSGSGGFSLRWGCRNRAVGGKLTSDISDAARP